MSGLNLESPDFLNLSLECTKLNGYSCEFPALRDKLEKKAKKGGRSNGTRMWHPEAPRWQVPWWWWQADHTGEAEACQASDQ